MQTLTGSIELLLTHPLKYHEHTEAMLPTCPFFLLPISFQATTNIFSIHHKQGQWCLKNPCIWFSTQLSHINGVCPNPAITNIALPVGIAMIAPIQTANAPFPMA